MVFPRAPGQEAFLSGFLTGTTGLRSGHGPRPLNELARRNRDMRQFARPGEPLPEPPLAARTPGCGMAGRPDTAPRRPPIAGPAARAAGARPRGRPWVAPGPAGE